MLQIYTNKHHTNNDTSSEELISVLLIVTVGVQAILKLKKICKHKCSNSVKDTFYLTKILSKDRRIIYLNFQAQNLNNTNIKLLQ